MDTPRSTRALLRVLFFVLCGSIGLLFGESFSRGPWIGVALGGLFGLMVILADRMLRGFSLRAFSSATIGLLIGYFFASLLRASGALMYQSEEVQWLASLGMYLSFGYLGMMLALRSNRDEFSLIIPYVRFTEQSVFGGPLLLDTNVIIDGRVRSLTKTGFLVPSFIVMQFVVDELQRLADSDDLVRKERGRRGLDLLNELKSDPEVELSFLPNEADSSVAVDALLIRNAFALNARILTNDANLCKVARIQGVKVLNVNELQNALHPQIRVGDEIEVALVKEGKDPQQGVGYLPDGTMVVVNNARSWLGKTARVAITGHTQTTAGRLFFAELRP